MAVYKTLVKKISISPDKKTKQKAYLKRGSLAIVDQGQSLIGGYTDDVNMAVECDLPVIVFGDHTRAVKYITFPFGAGADGIKILQPKESVMPLFLYYATQYIVAKMPDRGYARHYQYVEKENLTVPSISEQQRIVSRIEELFSSLDNAVETLQKTKEQLAVYRQAVLKELLSNDTWKQYRLGEIVKTEEGDRGKKYPKRSDYRSEGYCLFLNAQNVRPYGWNFEDTTFLTKEKHEELHGGTVQKGDVVITTRGTLGNVAVYDDSVSYEILRINSCMLILRCNRDIVSPYYLSKFIMSPMFRQLIQKQKSGTAQPQIPANQLRELKISVPPLEEQLIVISKIEERLSVCDSIEQTVNAALAKAVAMRQSILKEAFEGRL